jgi:hypothetical protein
MPRSFWTKLPAAGSVCVLVLLASSPLLGDTKAKTDSFAAVVETHFKKWDRDGDGKLSAKRVNGLLRDHSITGPAAAALAAIHNFQHVKKQNAPPLTLAFLTAAPRKGSPQSELADNYQSYHDHIANLPKQIFVDDKPPSLKGFSQGILGDCYYMAIVGAAVARNPVAVKKIFHVHADGSCDLKFVTGRQVHVPRLTEAEIALGGTAGTQGLWLNVLEEGLGLLDLRVSSKQGAAMDFIEAGAPGLSMDAIIGLFTGHGVEHFPIRQGNVKQPPPERDLPGLQAKLRSVLRRTAEHHGLVVAETPNGAKMPPGMSDNHTYALLRHDPDSDRVHIWNPWGEDFTPKGKPGLEFGYPHKGGHADMSLKDFVHIFENVRYETTGPAKMK